MGAPDRARNLRSPGVVVERTVGVGIMPSSVMVALDREPDAPVRIHVPMPQRVPAVGERVMAVRTKAGTIYRVEAMGHEDAGS